MIKRTIGAAATGLLAVTAAFGQPLLFQAAPSKASNVGYYATNYGIFGLNVVANASGFIVPRGSGRTYLSGSGLWFGARKMVDGTMNDLTLITYNPNSGGSWAAPGEGYRASVPEGEEPASPVLYHSMLYDHLSGEFIAGNEGNIPDDAHQWPLWSAPFALVRPLSMGSFVPLARDRAADVAPNNFAAPAFMPGVDEEFVSRFHDAELSRYEINGFGGQNPAALGYPLGLQMQQNIYSWKSGPLQDAVILQYTIINMSTDTLHDCVASQLWDLDIGLPSNDHGDFYTQRPELRTAFNWTEQETSGTYGVLTTTMLEAPMLDENGFIDNTQRARFRADGRVGTFANSAIEEDPTSPAARYSLISSGNINADMGAGDRRGVLGSKKFTMRPGDTAYFAIGYGVIAVAPFTGKSDELEHLVGTMEDFYYSAPVIIGGVEEPGAGAILSLAPNPARDMATLDLMVPARGRVEAILYDITGRAVSTLYAGERGMGEFSLPIDLSGVPSGPYYVVATVSGTVVRRQLTVIR